MEKREDLFILIQRYRQGTATEEEVRYLLHQIRSEERTTFVESVISEGLLDEPSDWMKQSADTRQKLDEVFEQVMQRRASASNIIPKPHSRVSVIRKWLPAAAAAVVLITFTLGWVFFTDPSPSGPNDVEPGGNRATLTLADGQVIDLKDVQTGIVVGEGITYLDGSLVTDGPANEGKSEQKDKAEGNHSFTSSQVHRLTTPTGGTYQITLSDGTKIWLNAASTLKYPARFDGKERIVELEGEAYFEVKSSEAWPFKVRSGSQTIEVLGTSFNLNAYPNEKAMTTTLVSGSLRVTLEGLSNSDDASVVLQPGEAAVNMAGRLAKQSGDLDVAAAWKDGYFVFNNATMETIAAQIGRWYGIDVDCVDLPQQTFSAELSRDVKLSTLMKLIESTSDLRCDLRYSNDPKGERRLMITK